MTTTLLQTTGAAAKAIKLPAFTRTRRALVRLQAAHATRNIIRELTAQPEPRPGHQPAYVRMDVITERYAALGGEPADLLDRPRRTLGAGAALRRLGHALQARHDDWLRRELDAGQAARAQCRETGGDFGVLP